MVEELTLEERLHLTRRIMEMLDAWGLSATDVCKVLDLPGTVKARAVARFRENTPLPDDSNVQRRVQYLFRISDALRTYFPRNPEMRDLWVKRGNKQFGKKAPLALMVEGGESGLIAVLSHLDCTYAWDLTGSKANYGN
jgi:hypothetical protein